MKSLKSMFALFTLLLILVSAMSVYAAEDMITLDDANPSIDAVISLPAGTTGGISVEMAGASLTLFDNMNNVVLQVADERVHHVQFNLMPDTGDHTLRLERLDNQSKAVVTINPIAEFLLQPTSQQVNSNQLGMDQATDVILNNTAPTANISVEIPSDTLGEFTATTPNTPTMSQFVDAEGAVLATSMSGHIDGLSLVLDGGNYQYTVLGMSLTNETTANVRVTPYDTMQNPLLYVPQTEDTASQPSDTAVVVSNTESNQSVGCNASVFVSSVNLRSGPGTGYSILGYGFHQETYPVGGTNSTNSWIVVGLDGGQSAWMTKSAASLSGDCNNLTTFDVPYREAQPAQIIVVTPDPALQPSTAVVMQAPVQQTYQEQSNNNNSSSNNKKHREHEDDDHEEHEDHEDDD